MDSEYYFTVRINKEAAMAFIMDYEAACSEGIGGDDSNLHTLRAMQKYYDLPSWWLDNHKDIKEADGL